MDTFGQANIETLDASDKHVSDHLYGPYSGWTAINYDSYPDGRGRLLWGDGAGSARISKLDAAGTLIGETTFGPYPEWTPVLYHINTDGTARLLWEHTSGQAYSLDPRCLGQLCQLPRFTVPIPAGQRQTMTRALDLMVSSFGCTPPGRHLSGNSIPRINFVSYVDSWHHLPAGQPKQVHQNLDGTGRLLWEHTSGQASLWTLDSVGQLCQLPAIMVPFPGWRAIQYQ